MTAVVVMCRRSGCEYLRVAEWMYIYTQDVFDMQISIYLCGCAFMDVQTSVHLCEGRGGGSGRVRGALHDVESH